MKTCLVIVDCQNDFVEGGALAVAGGMQVCSAVSGLLANSQYDLIVLTEDFHPSNHCSFKLNGGIWPVHCVQNTYGAHLQEQISTGTAAVLQRGNEVTVTVVHKGTDAGTEAYGAEIHADGIDQFEIVGIALDYCVLETARMTKKRYPGSRVVIKSAYTAAVDGSHENRQHIQQVCADEGIEWET